MVYAFLLLGLVLASLWLTKVLYRVLVLRGVKNNVAVYYNRKIIHMLAGGVTAALTPYIFTSPLIPFLFAIALAVLLTVPHRSGQLLNWFQTSENWYEVNFCLAWGTSLFVVWVATSNPFYAVVPPLFISFGDAITGVIRNLVYGRRTKSWLGNIGMLAVATVIGYHYAGLLGVVAGVAASLVEHFEFPPYLDDNVLISLVSTLILVSGRYL
ncbi:dolichol kinase [Thermogladius calderae]|uniref:dolichol kinase n=1 Tax=Thermogladius calderae TaxID=1200300 RepID=UPI001EE68EE6|nr:dolichol kinase [Thermogladius calderae]